MLENYIDVLDIQKCKAARNRTVSDDYMGTFLEYNGYLGNLAKGEAEDLLSGLVLCLMTCLTMDGPMELCNQHSLNKFDGVNFIRVWEFRTNFRKDVFNLLKILCVRECRQMSNDRYFKCY